MKVLKKNVGLKVQESNNKYQLIDMNERLKLMELTN